MPDAAPDRPAPAPLRVAAIGDVHASPHARGRWRDAFLEISRTADVLCLCGDLTNHGTPAEAEALAEDLRACTIPVLGVLGNHDHHCGKADEVEAILAGAGLQLLQGEVATIGDVGFAGVKGFGGGFDDKMLDAFGETAIKAFVQEAIEEALHLEHAIKQLHAERVVVLLHYAPIAATLGDEPAAIAPFLGSSRLAETIDRFDCVRAVFHGHAHHGAYRGETRRGIPVFNVAAPVVKPDGRDWAVIEI